jgi:protein-disulfide isomerase-like protein with CxxC motif
LALEISVAVRDAFPDSFLDLHAALFDARHADGISLTTRAQLAAVLSAQELDPDVIFSIVDEGGPRKIIASAWTHYHDDLDVFGVPTFVFDDADATFVRLMNGPDPKDPQASVKLISQLLGLIEHQPEINELKHTRLSR